MFRNFREKKHQIRAKFVRKNTKFGPTLILPFVKLITESEVCHSGEESHGCDLGGEAIQTAHRRLHELHVLNKPHKLSHST